VARWLADAEARAYVNAREARLEVKNAGDKIASGTWFVRPLPTCARKAH
jgi:hypothetical protein